MCCCFLVLVIEYVLMLVNYLIKEIKLYNDRAEVYLNNPLPISPEESQGFSFSRKIKRIPEYTGNGHLKNKRDFEIVLRI